MHYNNHITTWDKFVPIHYRPTEIILYIAKLSICPLRTRTNPTINLEFPMIDEERKKEKN